MNILLIESYVIQRGAIFISQYQLNVCRRWVQLEDRWTSDVYE